MGSRGARTTRSTRSATLLARRVEETRAWERAGHRNAAEFVAQRSGSSVGAARTQLAVSKQLEQLPAVADAVRNGQLSTTQAELVADGAPRTPTPPRGSSRWRNAARCPSCATPCCAPAPPQILIPMQPSGASTAPGSCAPGATPTGAGTSPPAAASPTALESKPRANRSSTPPTRRPGPRSGTNRGRRTRSTPSSRSHNTRPTPPRPPARPRGP
ncbi:MAG: DUF222 domain-containing protein [Actinobacteria bacterium]|nr:DUF222 domain-containing protein [Actinomycetota bacterium]